MGCILSVDKCSSTNYAVVSDIITYQIVVKNVSNIIAENVIVKDLLPEELKFIIESVKVNYEPDTYSNIISGVRLGKILPDEVKIVTFDAQIIKKISDCIENKALVEFRYQSEEQSQYDCCYSDIHRILVKKPSLNILKKADKYRVQLDDEINYTIIITNNGDLDADNVYLVDNISSSVRLIDGTFSIGSKIVNSVEIEKGVMLDNIKKDETLVVKYTAKVISSGCNGKIENDAKVLYSYTLENGFTGYTQSNNVNTCIEMEISTFKQISIDECLYLPCQKPNIEDINDIKASVKIKKSNVIKTCIGKSSEGQILSGYKLIVHGDIDQIIEYVADEPTQSVHSAHYSAPFSSYIVLPNDFILGSKVDVEGIVEEIYYNKIDERCFFKNVLLLVVAKITCCNQ